MKITIPISVGELIDKITILEIKSSFINNEFVLKELQELNEIKLLLQDKIDLELIKKLKKVNEKLWNIEDKIRIKEKLQEFDDEFVELARSVYKTNDLRFELKRKINEVTNSIYKEIKIY
jgi:hypothetical protein